MKARNRYERCIDAEALGLRIPEKQYFSCFGLKNTATASFTSSKPLTDCLFFRYTFSKYGWNISSIYFSISSLDTLYVTLRTREQNVQRRRQICVKTSRNLG